MSYKGFLKKSAIPDCMHDPIIRYVEDGVMPGRFLQRVLANDFSGAVVSADDQNIMVLRDYACLMFNDLPGDCWGSPQKVGAWAVTGGLNGRKEK